jgi:hypothetical protein
MAKLQLLHGVIIAMVNTGIKEIRPGGSIARQRMESATFDSTGLEETRKSCFCGRKGATKIGCPPFCPQLNFIDKNRWGES